MKITLRTVAAVIIGVAAYIPGKAQDKWDRLFLSGDQSTLAHNLVASYDPIPHAWEGFSLAQSPTGRLLIPKILTMHTGHVYTPIGKGSVADQNITGQQWLPWLFEGWNQDIKVSRTTGQDKFMCHVELKRQKKGLMILEFDKFYDHYYRNSTNTTYEFKPGENQLIFTWQDYLITVQFDKQAKMELCQEPEPLLRKFEGFNDVAIKPKSVKSFFDRNGSVYAGITFGRSTDMSVTVRLKHAAVAPIVPFKTAVTAEKKYYTAFLEKDVPPVKSTDPVIRDTYYFAWATFLANHADGGYGMAPYPFESSSKFMYPGGFYWDEAFHSIIFSYLKDRDKAYQFIRNFAYLQAKDGGMAGGVNITGDREAYLKKADSLGSGDMQPPILSIMLPEVRKRKGWPKDLPSIYQVLSKNLKWYYSPSRDSDGDGLLEYTDSFASGCDNSPRWDSQYLPGFKIGKMHAVEAVDLNVWIVNMHYLLADMADTLGKSEEAVENRRKARLLTAKIEATMWNEKDGFYYDLQAVDNKMIKVKTPMSFAVLHLPGINPERVRRVVKEHLLNPKEFWTTYPVPTVALNEKAFDPQDMWRGPVWINVNWMIADGLQKQGFSSEARELAQKTVRLVGSKYDRGKRIRTPKFNEYFNPLSGQPLGNENLTWSTLVIDLIKRYE